MSHHYCYIRETYIIRNPKLTSIKLSTSHTYSEGKERINYRLKNRMTFIMADGSKFTLARVTKLKGAASSKLSGWHTGSDQTTGVQEKRLEVNAAECHNFLWAVLYCILLKERKKSQKKNEENTCVTGEHQSTVSVNLKRIITKKDKRLSWATARKCTTPPRHIAAGKLPSSKYCH